MAEAIDYLRSGDATVSDDLLQARAKIANLEIALVSSRHIGMAMGIVMAQFRVTEDQAFDLLRLVSQHEQMKLREVAEAVIITGALDTPAGR